MSSQDDIVFIPDLTGLRAPTDAVERMREERRMATAGKRGGWINRIKRLREARDIRRMRKRSRSRQVMRAGASRRIGGFALRKGASFAARRAAGTPIGFMVAAAVTAAIVKIRIETGTPLEGLGEELNEIFLGQYDDDARAATKTRARFQTDDALAFIAGGKGGPTKQQLRLYSELKGIAKKEEVGASALRRAFPENNVFDILVEKFAKEFGNEAKQSLFGLMKKVVRRIAHVLANPTEGRKKKSR